MARNPQPLPKQVPVVEMERSLNETWEHYLNQQAGLLATAPSRVSTVSYSGQNASLAAVDITNGALTNATGLYRITYYARVTTVAGVSSSLTLNFAWTDETQAMTQSSAALMANSVAAPLNGTLLINCDANTAVNFSTTYASNAAGAMHYKASVTLERVDA